ncbi:Hypothetical_protein [Hexamita inflata]|uniref:Hypothetical_protein n=1 Tax=Hexamita inflata TaxID=28002 RepID=A0ABP1HI61_9EUKA
MPSGSFKHTARCQPCLQMEVGLVQNKQILIVLKQRWHFQFNKFVVGFSVLRQIYRIFGYAVQQPLINLQFKNNQPKILVYNGVQNDQNLNASKLKPQLDI